VLGKQRRNSQVSKTLQASRDKKDYKMYKLTDKASRIQSSRLLLSQEREAHLHRTVTDVHAQLERKSSVARQEVKVGQLVKRAVREEWAKTSHENTKKFARW